MIDRRGFIASAAATLAMPAVARAAGASTIKFVPAADVPSLDPVWTSASQTRDHAMMVYDTLYGLDDGLRALPQMAAGHVVSDEGRRWTITLRDGLVFHDGSKVLGRDAVASIRRWGKRDSFGQVLLAATDEISAPDDKTIVFRLKHPFGSLPDALAKMSGPCVIMPERLASTDAFMQVTDPTGSGPFRLKADERVPGARIVWEKFPGYIPREGGVVQGTSGPKRVFFDRVEWNILPDGATASQALQRGEVDWLLWPLVDLLPKLRRAPGVVVKVIQPSGLVGILRFNHLHPPFDKAAVRRALLPAFDQTDYMIAANGEDSSLWHQPVGFFTPDTPMASDVGMQALTSPRNLAAAQKALKESGYNGERTVVMSPVDFAIYRAMADVTGQLLKQIGFNVDVQSMDWATAMQRRAKPEPVEQGGWSVFHTGWGGPDMLNPVANIWLRGNGQGGAPGWPTNPAIEALRDGWLHATDIGEQKRLCAELQGEAFAQLPYIPTGQLFNPTACRSNLEGMLLGLPAFWNIRRS